MAGFESFNCVKLPGNRSGGGQVGKIQYQKFFRVISHPKRVIDHQRVRVNPIQQMRRRDIVHIKGRILAQPDHIKISQINFGFRA